MHFNILACILQSDSQMQSFCRNSWLVLACAFCNFVLISGVLFSFGMLFVELLDAFRAGKSKTAWIGSVQIGMYHLGGVIAGSMVRRFDIMKTVVAGALLSSVGMLSSSFATNIYILYLTYGLLSGLGFVMVGLPNLVAVNQSFDKQQALALGIFQAGGSVGGFIFNPLVQIFIESYGWNGALLLLSAILLHGILFGLLINAFRRKRNPVSTKQESKNDEEAKDLLSKHKVYVNSKGPVTLNLHSLETKTISSDNIVVAFNDTGIKENINSSELSNVPKKEQHKHEHFNVVDETLQELDLDNSTVVDAIQNRKQNKCLSILNQLVPYQVLGHRASLIFLLSAFIRSFGFFVPFVLLPDLAVENHISKEKAAWLASAMGISGAVGRILLGWIADFRSIDRIYLYIFVLLGSGVLCGICPLLSSYYSLMTYACIFGFLIGGECSLTPLICSDVAGRDKLAEMYGMLQTLFGIGVTCGIPFSGWLFEKTRGYSTSFILTGVLISVSGLLLLPLKFIQKY